VGQADIFSVEWHRLEDNKRGCRASRQKSSRPPRTGGKSGATWSEKWADIFSVEWHRL